MIAADELRQTLADIQTSISQVQNSAVKTEDLTSVVNTAVQSATAPLVSRIDQCEAATRALNDKLTNLTARLDAYVEAASKPAGSSPGPERKRACIGSAARSSSAPASTKHTHAKPVIVLKGFPTGSRKKEIESFMKDMLALREEWKDLTAFAPNVRSSIALIRVDSNQEVRDFIRLWKDQNDDVTQFKGHVIRASVDKPPEKRKANDRVYNLASYLQSKMVDKDVDADFKNASVWLGDSQIATWDVDTETFLWKDDIIQSAGLQVDKVEAEAFTAKK